MIRHLKLFALVLALSLLLSACASAPPVYKPVEVRIPVAVPCHAPAVDKPASQLAKLPEQASLFETARALLIDRELSAAYEEQLEAAVKACS